MNQNRVCVICPQAKLPAQTEVITTEDLMAHLGKKHRSVYLHFHTDFNTEAIVCFTHLH